MSIKEEIKKQVNKDLLKNPKLEWWLSWPVIIVATIVFWPVGVFLIWRRISLDKKTAMLSGKVIFIAGWVFLAFAALGIAVCSGEGFKSEDKSYITFFTIAGIVLVLLGRSTKKNAIKFKKYITIIINKEITSIDNIAAAMPVTYDVCKKDLQKMIDKGYFDGAYIDESAREVVLPKHDYADISEPTVSNGSRNVEMQVVVCKGCGANNKIPKGTTGECEYCGSALS